MNPKIGEPEEQGKKQSDSSDRDSSITGIQVILQDQVEDSSQQNALKHPSRGFTEDCCASDATALGSKQQDTSTIAEEHCILRESGANRVLEREVASLKELNDRHYQESQEWKNACAEKSREASLASAEARKERGNAENLRKILKSIVDDCKTLCTNSTIKNEDLKNVLSVCDELDIQSVRNDGSEIASTQDKVNHDKDEKIKHLVKELENLNTRHSHTKELIASLECLVEEKGNLVKDMYLESRNSSVDSSNLAASLGHLQRAKRSDLYFDKSVNASLVTDTERKLSETVTSLSTSLDSLSEKNSDLVKRLAILTEDLNHSKDMFRQKCEQIIRQQDIHNDLKKKDDQHLDRVKSLEQSVLEQEDKIKSMDRLNSDKDGELKVSLQTIAKLEVSNREFEKELSASRCELERVYRDSQEKSTRLEELENDIRCLRRDIDESNARVEELSFPGSAQEDYKAYMKSVEHCMEQLVIDNDNLKKANLDLSTKLCAPPPRLADFINHVLNSPPRKTADLKKLPYNSTHADVSESKLSTAGTYSSNPSSELKSGSEQPSTFNPAPGILPQSKSRDTDTLDRTYMKGIVLKLIKIDKSHRAQLSRILGRTLDFSQEELSLLEKFLS